MKSAEQVRIPEGYKQTEVGVIPEDWKVLPIGSFSEVSSGGTPSRENKDYWGGDIPWVTTTLINGGEICTAEQFITDKAVAGSATKWFKKGTLLIAMYGQGKTRGKVSVLGIDATINQACAGIAINKLVAGDFLLHYLNSQYENIRDLSNSGGQENLSGNIVKLINVPVPPEKEQTAIANALSDVDSLIASLETLITKKSAIKTAAMQQLLTGKKRLPGFDGKSAKESEKQGAKQSSDHSADSGSMHKGTQSNASQISASLTKSAGQTAPRPGYKQTELGEIPEDWEVVELGDIAEFYKGKGLPKSELTDGGAYKCIHYGELFTHYSEKITEIKSLTDTTANTFLSKSNDILMPTSDVTPNGLATASGLKEDDIILGGDVLVIRPKQGRLDSTYFAYIISISKNQVMQLVSGSTVYHLYGSDMATFKYAGPQNIEEQAAIANVLSDMDTELDALQQRLSKTQKIKQGMMQELLTGKTRLV